MTFSCGTWWNCSRRTLLRFSFQQGARSLSYISDTPTAQIEGNCVVLVNVWSAACRPSVPSGSKIPHQKIDPPWTRYMRKKNWIQKSKTEPPIPHPPGILCCTKLRNNTVWYQIVNFVDHFISTPTPIDSVSLDAKKLTTVRCKMDFPYRIRQKLLRGCDAKPLDRIEKPLYELMPEVHFVLYSCNKKYFTCDASRIRGPSHTSCEVRVAPCWELPEHWPFGWPHPSHTFWLPS